MQEYSVVLVGGMAMIAVLVLSSLVTGKRDRQRIQKDVESRGGQVFSIERPAFDKGGLGRRYYDRTYKVCYMAGDGKRLAAVCKTSPQNGVLWLTDSPPGLRSISGTRFES